MKKILLLICICLAFCNGGYSANLPSLLAINKIKEITALKQGKPTEAHVIGIIKKYYDDSEWQVRLAAVELIGVNLTHDFDVVYVIRKALRDESDDVKIAAIQKIPAVYYDSLVIEYLATELLTHPNHAIRAFVAKSLAEYSQSTNALLVSVKDKIENDQQPDVRSYAKEMKICSHN